MKHLTLALILTLAGLAPYAHAQEDDRSTEAGSAHEQQDCKGLCMSQVQTSPSFIQRAPDASMQMGDDIFGKVHDSSGGSSTGR